MKNHWMDEIQIKEAVVLIEKLLIDEFKDTYPEPDKWIDKIIELLDIIYSNDKLIVIGLMEYKVICDLNEYGLVETISLEKK